MWKVEILFWKEGLSCVVCVCYFDASLNSYFEVLSHLFLRQGSEYKVNSAFSLIDRATTGCFGWHLEGRENLSSLLRGTLQRIEIASLQVSDGRTHLLVVNDVAVTAF